ncbi:MAG: hypothetical protein EOO45_00555 [Flavobacterium sp.]|nr:MAG: hypothetical protein EOO45_00555 [Flavobacterium sp.]
MEVKFLFLIFFAVLLFGYYLYVLYKTLQYKRKYDKSADARDLYLRTGLFQFLLFRNLFKDEVHGTKYKILKNEQEEEDE